jgi:carbohydrate-selective porin OprB
MVDWDYGAQSFHYSPYGPIFLQPPLTYISQPKGDFTNEGFRVVITTSIWVKMMTVQLEANTDWHT